MSKFYFFKTLKIDGREKLRPLPNQTDNEGNPIKDTLNTQVGSGDMLLRTTYPLGTIFVSDNISESKGFYTTGGHHIFPVGIPEGDYKDMSHKPTEEMKKAYRDFLARTGTPEDTIEDIFRAAEKEAEESAKRAADSFLSKLKEDPRYACPTIKDSGFYVSEDDWYFILSNVINRQPLLLTGPTGCGKTEILLMACERLGLPLHKYDMGGIHDPMEQLLGTHRLEHGDSTFDYSQFALDIQTEGVILLDELSRAPRDTNNILLPLLDNTRVLKVEMAGGKDMRSISVHPRCTFVATANVGDEYTGTTDMDAALVNRFMPMELNYLPEDIETEVLMAKEKISREAARSIVSVAQTVRRKKNSRDIIGDNSISTREALQAARLVNWGYTPLKAMERAFLPLFHGNDKEGDRAIVKAIFATL